MLIKTRFGGSDRRPRRGQAPMATAARSASRERADPGRGPSPKGDTLVIQKDKGGGRRGSISSTPWRPAGRA
ncbi:hypothetical protein ACRAWD_30835 [Caulobacter segnis]